MSAPQILAANLGKFSHRVIIQMYKADSLIGPSGPFDCQRTKLLVGIISLFPDSVPVLVRILANGYRYGICTILSIRDDLRHRVISTCLSISALISLNVHVNCL